MYKCHSLTAVGATVYLFLFLFFLYYVSPITVSLYIHAYFNNITIPTSSSLKVGMVILLKKAGPQAVSASICFDFLSHYDLTEIIIKPEMVVFGINVKMGCYCYINTVRHIKKNLYFYFSNSMFSLHRVIKETMEKVRLCTLVSVW